MLWSSLNFLLIYVIHGIARSRSCLWSQPTLRQSNHGQWVHINCDWHASNWIGWREKTVANLIFLSCLNSMKWNPKCIALYVNEVLAKIRKINRSMLNVSKSNEPTIMIIILALSPILQSHAYQYKHFQSFNWY